MFFVSEIFKAILPGLQIHEKLFKLSIHRPEFKHGFTGSHSFLSISHCSPKRNEKQYFFIVSHFI